MQKKHRGIPQKRFGARKIHLLICLQICDIYQVNKSTSGNMKGALVGIFKTSSFLLSTCSIKFRGHEIFSIVSLRILEGY